MKFKELLRHILFYVSVPKCIECGEILEYNARPLCDKCHKKYSELKLSECSVCFNKIGNCTCSNPFMEKHFIKKACKVYRYRRDTENQVGNNLIYSLKQDNRRDVIDFLASELASAIIENKVITHSIDEYVITSVPRRKRAIRHYGYDHARLLAIAVANRLGVQYEQLLISKTRRAQKEVAKDDRFANVQLDYIKRISDISGKHVIIIDDIITSGSSMSACATLIKGLGAKTIMAACIATAYKDKYVPFTKGN